MKSSKSIIFFLFLAAFGVFAVSCKKQVDNEKTKKEASEEIEADKPYTGWVNRRRVVEWTIIIIAILVAVITSLKLNYVDKPFGTPFDYLSMIFLSGGIDSGAIGAALFAAKQLS